MPILEVFFDYACPFCMRGHDILLDTVKLFPQIKIEWRPCEAHPRPERYGIHSDLCARGMYCAQEAGADLAEYHRIMYNAALKEKADIENLNVVAKLASSITDSTQFYNKLLQGFYTDRLSANNNSAWEIYNFSAVPSYCLNGKLLVSAENIGITKERLEAFLKANA